jgi:hypothetical protein
MLRTLGFWALWAGFIGYAFLLAPPDQPDTLTLIQNLSTGAWDDINPIVIALFNLMGIFPLIYSGVLYADGRGQTIPAWPFAIGSFAVGAFALLPYLALRKPSPKFEGEKTFLIRLFDSRWLGGAIAIGAVGLLTYGLTQGDWLNFIELWQTSRFIHVMSLDFCLLCLLFPALLGDDMVRRGLPCSTIFAKVALIPLLGPAFYLMLRPPLRNELITMSSSSSESMSPTS